MTVMRWGVLAAMTAAVVWPAGAKEIERFADWHYETSTDPMTDEASFTGWLAAESDSPDAAVMIIGCNKPKAPLQIAVKFSAYLGGPDGYRDFTWRYRSWTPVTEQWKYVSGSVVGNDLPEPPSELRNALNNGGPFYVRAVKASGGVVDATFDLLGGGSLVTRLLIDCKLDPRFP